MKKIITALLAVSTSIWAQAALVVDVDVVAPTTYVGQPNDRYMNEPDPAMLGPNPGDEPLIWLGLHDTLGDNNPMVPNQVGVHLGNGSGGIMLEPISLVLSSAKETEWLFTIDDGVKINNIFVFSSALADQTFTGVDNSLISFGEEVCGFALDAANYQGCETDEILGTTGLPFPLGPNYLADITSLHVTNFNGAYAVDSFDVQISAIPLPGALVFFASGLMALTSGRRLVGKQGVA